MVDYYTQVVATDVAGYIDVPAEGFNGYAVAAPVGVVATIRIGDGGQKIDVALFPVAKFCETFGGRIRLEWAALAGKRIGLLLTKDADVSTVVG